MTRQKPSIAPKPVISQKPQIAPKPKNVRRQGHSHENVLENGKREAPVPVRRIAPKSNSMSILSPTDLDKEWEGIATFVKSLNFKNGMID